MGSLRRGVKLRSPVMQRIASVMQGLFPARACTWLVHLLLSLFLYCPLIRLTKQRSARASTEIQVASDEQDHETACHVHAQPHDKFKQADCFGSTPEAAPASSAGKSADAVTVVTVVTVITVTWRRSADPMIF